MKTVNHEYYVSLEVAKMLKEAGFDWDVMHFYDDEFENGVCPFYSRGAEELQQNMNALGYYSAPTLDVAQRWLREKKRCFVEVNYDDCQKHYWTELFINEDDGGGIPFNGNVFAMFEEALEAGIKKALEIILEKGE